LVKKWANDDKGGGGKKENTPKTKQGGGKDRVWGRQWNGLRDSGHRKVVASLQKKSGEKKKAKRPTPSGVAEKRRRGRGEESRSQNEMSRSRRGFKQALGKGSDESALGVTSMKKRIKAAKLQVGYQGNLHEKTRRGEGCKAEVGGVVLAGKSRETKPHLGEKGGGRVKRAQKGTQECRRTLSG